MVREFMSRTGINANQMSEKRFIAICREVAAWAVNHLR
jgi:hypothetical protein